MSSVDPGRCWIRGTVENRTIIFRSRLGPTAPRVTSGYGGWEIKPRYRRRSITQWTGSDPVKVELDIMIDNLDDRGSIETQINNLEKLAGLTHDGWEPAKVLWAANAPHDADAAPGRRWVIESIEWGDSVGNHFGNRIRQSGTVVLMTYTEAEYASFGTTAGKNRGRKKGGKKHSSKKKRYAVRVGEDLYGIAARLLGDPRRAAEIASLNGIRDPRSVRAGDEIRLP